MTIDRASPSFILKIHYYEKEPCSRCYYYYRNKKKQKDSNHFSFFNMYK